MTSIRTPHGDDELLVRMACNELDAAERAEVQAHLDSCDECMEVWRAVELVRKEARRFDPGAPAAPDPRFSVPTGRRFAVAVAAVLLAFVSLYWIVLGRQTSTGPESGSDPVRSAAAELPEPLFPSEGLTVMPPVTFRWVSVVAARDYVVEVIDEEGEVFWSSEPITRPEVAWPADSNGPSTTYYWRVSARLGDGEESKSSSIVAFQLGASLP